MANSDDVEMNSRAFWEAYFDGDWEANDGAGQTRHFMRQLIANLPPAVLGWMLDRSLEVIDWGCAYGEGAELLAESLPLATVRGLDFSQTAIEEARRRYPSVEFVWTEDGSIPAVHDVIVTSNCLEHFEEPLPVLRRHLASCRSVYIALVPYKEVPMHEQHMAQFRLESFPEKVDGWTRAAAIPIPLENAYWPGWQLLAVYVSPQALSAYPELSDDSDGAAGAAACAVRAIHRGAIAAEVEAAHDRAQLARLNHEVVQLRLEQERLAEESADRLQVEAQRLQEAERRLQEAERRLQNTERRLQDTERRLQDSERRRRETEQRLADAERLVDERAKALDALSRQLGESTRLLRREETTVAKPILRRSARAAGRLGRRMSPERQQAVRAFLAPLVVRVAPRSAQANVYTRARETRRVRRPSVALEVTRTAPSLLPPSARPDSLDIIVLPVIDWHFRHQRPQQIATHLADAGHRVVYLTTTFDRPRAHGQAFSLLEQVHPGVHVARVVCPDPQPVIYEDRLDAYQAAVVADAMRSLIRELGLDRVAIAIHHPFWLDVVSRLPENVLIYDLMDDHEGFDNTASWVIDAERRLLQLVDLTTVTSPSLQSKVPGRSALVRNGAEVRRFAEAADRAVMDASGALRVGYVGAIAHWFDTALVRACAEAHPEWQFVLVGDTTGSDVSRLDGLPNVELLGERPYEEVPGLVASFDVCLIPFLVIPLTEHTNPVKAYEYLAAGKPVVATAMPEVVKMAPHVHIGEDTAGFIRALEGAADGAGDEKRAAERAAWAATHDWGRRAEAIERSIRELYVETSVVVLCYGNLDLTQRCLESLERHTRYLNWELVLVDNASPDGTAVWLRDFARGKNHVVVVENEENLGFAGGNNAGVRASSGDFVVLLNNDTYVTDGWLHGLVRHLRDDESIGLVGPVTNNIGNEARIDIQYADMQEMGQRASEWTAAHPRGLLQVNNVAFFCVALRRSTWDAVGELDDRFGMGFFEDDDYCRRVLDKGLRIVIAEDVFVHHHLSAAFDALGAAHKRALFERNRQLFEEKWGTGWSPHRARTAGA